MKTETFIALIAIASTIISNAIWFVSAYSNSEKKKYAAEREFNHLKKNQEQLLNNLTNIFQDLEQHLRFIDRDLQEIKYRLGCSPSSDRDK